MAALCGPSTLHASQISSKREVPWLAQVQTPPARLPADAPRLPSLLIDAKGRQITTLEAWEARREEMRNDWLAFLGSWDPPRRPPPFEVQESERTGNISRRLIKYENESGDPVEAYLLMPARAAGRTAGVVVMHSTVDYTIRQGAGLEGAPEAAWGLKLAERGFVAICPRCFIWDGSSPVDYLQPVDRHLTRHPGSRGMTKMLFDAQRAVDVLSSLPEVDPQRIGAAGHSLGAKEALYLAAFDKRIKATVSSEGGIGTKFSNWDAPWYLGTKQVPREHHELLGLVAPRAFLLIGGESADGARSWPFIAAALEAYPLHGQPSRVGLFNHGKGHTIPPSAEARTYEWLQTYL